MMNIAEFIKNMDMDKFTKKFAQKMQKDMEEKEIFWNSSLCQIMIDDIKRVNQGFNTERFAYFPEQIKLEFGWEYISDDDINHFINVMADSQIGIDEKSEKKVDEDCIFDNYSFIKKGILISVMHGQGTAISLSPETDCNPK